MNSGSDYAHNERNSNHISPPAEGPTNGAKYHNQRLPRGTVSRGTRPTVTGDLH